MSYPGETVFKRGVMLRMHLPADAVLLKVTYGHQQKPKVTQIWSLGGLIPSMLPYTQKPDQVRSWSGRVLIIACTIFILSKVKLEVSSPVSSASAALLTRHSYSLVTEPCSFLSHLDLPGVHRARQPQVLVHMTNHTHKTSQSYQVPTFTPGSIGSTCVSRLCPRHSVNSKFNPASNWTRNLSLASCTCYHWATDVPAWCHVMAWCVRCSAPVCCTRYALGCHVICML